MTAAGGDCTFMPSTDTFSLKLTHTFLSTVSQNFCRLNAYPHSGPFPPYLRLRQAAGRDLDQELVLFDFVVLNVGDRVWLTGDWMRVMSTDIFWARSTMPWLGFTTYCRGAVVLIL